jgi:hypothetical protein
VEFTQNTCSGKKVAFIPTTGVPEKVTFFVDSDKKSLEKLGLIIDELEVSKASQIVPHCTNFPFKKPAEKIIAEYSEKLDLRPIHNEQGVRPYVAYRGCMRFGHKVPRSSVWLGHSSPGRSWGTLHSHASIRPVKPSHTERYALIMRIFVVWQAGYFRGFYLNGLPRPLDKTREMV